LLKLLAIVGDFYPLISLYIWSWWSTEGTHLRTRKQAGCKEEKRFLQLISLIYGSEWI
jgi:hypothetical protein